MFLYEPEHIVRFSISISLPIIPQFVLLHLRVLIGPHMFRHLHVTNVM